MPARSIIILVLGILIALGTAYSLKSRMRNAQAPAAVTKVLIANAAIPAGSFVRADSQLALADWPESNITESMLTSQTVKASDFDGSVARRTINKGEPITGNALVKSSEGGFMSAVLDPGKRAVSIAVDSTTGNAGFIFPGDHVDLILTHQIDVTGGVERASETFIEDARVLAVDQMLNNPENKAVLAKTVTLEVTPKQAEEINVAKDLGKISLSLRSLATKRDDALVDDPTTNLDDVLQVMPTPDQNVTRDTDVSKVITPRDAAGTKVRILRGGVAPEEIDFSVDGNKMGGQEDVR
jgi:pilus assembly protein CpaB